MRATPRAESSDRFGFQRLAERSGSSRRIRGRLSSRGAGDHLNSARERSRRGGASGRKPPMHRQFDRAGWPPAPAGGRRQASRTRTPAGATGPWQRPAKRRCLLPVHSPASILRPPEGARRRARAARPIRSATSLPAAKAALGTIGKCKHVPSSKPILSLQAPDHQVERG